MSFGTEKFKKSAADLVSFHCGFIAEMGCEFTKEKGVGSETFLSNDAAFFATDFTD
jgi:hypothetical protein